MAHRLRARHSNSLPPRRQRQVAATPGAADLNRCIQCGKCSATRPVSVWMDLTPRRVACSSGLSSRRSARLCSWRYFLSRYFSLVSFSPSSRAPTISSLPTTHGIPRHVLADALVYFSASSVPHSFGTSLRPSASRSPVASRRSKTTFLGSSTISAMGDSPSNSTPTVAART